MKAHDDLPQLRHTIHASWTAYAWIMVIFSVIAICGRIIGEHLGH